MPKYTYGSEVKTRVKRLLEALLDFGNWEFEDRKFDIKFKWEAENSANPKLIIETTLVVLEYLTEKDKYPGKLTKPQIRDALNLLKDFLKILEDNRTQTRGADSWHFTLRLWSKDKKKNLDQFEQAWETSRPEKSKALQANSQKSDESYWQEICGALENFETYRLLNFEYPKQVQEFIGRWFQPRNLTPQPPLLIKERGSNKGEQLWRELNQAERQRIQDLVKNPLRLALLCSTWQSSDRGLPETKAGLYQQFVNQFYTWKKNSVCKTQKQRQTLNVALGRLAKRAIDTETFRFRLRHEFVSNELGDPEEEDSLFWLALKLGWLNEVGLAAESPKEKVYAFYHTTFEEYFAALAVENWHEFLNHVPDNPALGVYRIFTPQWKEVISLWFGREDVEREKKEEFIQALVEFDDGCGEYRGIDRVTKGFYEFRAYFLAAAGVDEWKNSCKADAIVKKIVKWGFDEFEVERNKSVKFLTPIAEGARKALPETNCIKAIDVLIELIANPQLDDYTDDDSRWQAVKSLGTIGSGNQTAIAALVELIGNPQLNDYIRRQAAESLEKIMLEEQMPSVVTALKDYLSPKTYENDFKRFDNCYKIIWKCAQSMPYPAFYQAWHQQEKVKD